MSDNPRTLLREARSWLAEAYWENPWGMLPLRGLIDRIDACLEPPAASPDAPFPDSRDNSTCECLIGEEVKFGR